MQTTLLLPPCTKPLCWYYCRNVSVNKAAQEICLCQLLRNRGKLLVLAQERVRESGIAKESPDPNLMGVV